MLASRKGYPNPNRPNRRQRHTKNFFRWNAVISLYAPDASALAINIGPKSVSVGKIELARRNDVNAREIKELPAAIHHRRKVRFQKSSVPHGGEESAGIGHRFGWEAFLDEGVIDRSILGQGANDDVLHIFEIGLGIDGHARVVTVPVLQRRVSPNVRAECDEAGL